MTARRGDEIGAAAELGSTHRRSIDITPIARRWPVAGLSATLAALLTLALLRILPNRLEVATDIVGTPIHNNFNINRYYHVYLAWAVFFPLATLAMYAMARRLLCIDRPGSVELVVDAPYDRLAPHIAPPKEALGQLGRIVLVGTVFGLELAIVRGWTGHAVSLGIALVSVVYLAALLLLVLVIKSTGLVRARTEDALATGNALIAPLGIAGLIPVSRTAQVFIESEQVTVGYDWLPLPIAIAVTLAAVTIVAILLHQCRRPAPASVERPVVFAVSGALIVFLLVSAIPGVPAPLDPFHEGEALAAARWTGQGMFPWRDLMFVHGPMFDVVRPLFGLHFIEDSRWGATAGEMLVTVPLYWVGWYLAAVYLLRRNWGTLLLAATIYVTQLPEFAHVRFVLAPYVFLLFVAVLRKRNTLRPTVFTVAAFALFIGTPESAPFVGMLLLFIPVYEILHRGTDERLRDVFHRTAVCLVAGLVLTAAWAAWLARYHALDDFLLYFRTVSTGHRWAAGLRFHPDLIAVEIVVAMVAPVLLGIGAIWYVAAHRRRLRDLHPDEWLILAIAFGGLLYYPKFLNRADGHVFHVWAIAVPALLYVGHRVIDYAERCIARLPRLEFVGRAVTPRLIGVPATCALLAFGPVPFNSVVGRIAGHVRVSVPTPARSMALGYAVEGTFDPVVLDDLQRIVAAYVGPNGTLFDFTNAPAIFHYLLNARPATRYYDVSIAFRPSAQEDLVREMERSRPKLVVFSADKYGLRGWDGVPTPVRHHDVSRYLFREYQPFFAASGYLFYWRVDAGPPPVEPEALGLHGTVVRDDLYFGVEPCNWGFAPGFMPARPRALPHTTVQARSASAVELHGWAVDMRVGRAAREVIAVVDGKVVGRATPNQARPDVAAALNMPSVEVSGYEMQIEVSTSIAPSAVHMLAIGVDGVVSELSSTPAGEDRAPFPRDVHLDGKAIALQPGAVDGRLDTMTSTQLFHLAPPPGKRWADYEWVELSSDGSFTDASFTLTDDANAPNHAILFRTRDKMSSPYRVRVGSCSQWHGYGDRPLSLVVEGESPVKTITLSGSS